MNGEVEIRTAEVADVSFPNRTIELIVMPYETETTIRVQQAPKPGRGDALKGFPPLPVEPPRRPRLEDPADDDADKAEDG